MDRIHVGTYLCAAMLWPTFAIGVLNVEMLPTAPFSDQEQFNWRK